MSSSVDFDNKRKYILVLGEGPTDGLDGTKLTAERCIQLTLLWLERNFVQVCIIMKQIVTYFLMAQKLLNSKLKILLNLISLCLGNAPQELKKSKMKCLS